MAENDNLFNILDKQDNWVLNAAQYPDFENEGYVHDWRKYIPYRLERIWHCLSLETKVVAVIMAEEQAHKEEWD